MLTTRKVREVLRQPWWTLVKNEVARAVAIRIKTEDREIRPHGTVLGQMFIDVLNEHPDCRGYFHYLTTRNWDEILTDLGDDLSDPMLEVLRHEQGAQWFAEFQKFLITAWNKSVTHPAPEDGAQAEVMMPLSCPRCLKPVGKIDRTEYWRIRREVPFFCVWHPDCEGLKEGESLDAGVTVRKEAT